MVDQLSVFLVNRSGRLDQVLLTLKENNINILSVSMADTSDYGLLRMLVDDPAKARDVLKKAGLTSMINPVIAVSVHQTPGSLEKVLHVINEAGINIEYMYGLSVNDDGAAIAIKTSDLEKTVELLKDTDVKFYTLDEIASFSK